MSKIELTAELKDSVLEFIYESFFDEERFNIHLNKSLLNDKNKIGICFVIKDWIYNNHELESYYHKTKELIKDIEYILHNTGIENKKVDTGFWFDTLEERKQAIKENHQRWIQSKEYLEMIKLRNND